MNTLSPYRLVRISTLALAAMLLLTLSVAPSALATDQVVSDCGNGGGILNFGAITVTNSTFSGNSATSGGGIYNGGAANITNVTLSGNSAPTFNGIVRFSGTVNLKNTIIAKDANGVNCYNFAGAVSIFPTTARARSAQDATTSLTCCSVRSPTTAA